MNLERRGRIVTFVRHALPEVDPHTRPSEWGLSTAGVDAAMALDIPSDATIVSSPELKALQTVTLATGVAEDAVVIDPAFREVDRIEAVHDGFREARRAWVAGERDERHEGWEVLEQAANRLTDGLRRYDAPRLLVGTHGMVLTAWMVSCGAIDPGLPAVDFWESLSFPHVLTVELLISGRVAWQPRDSSSQGR